MNDDYRCICLTTWRYLPTIALTLQGRDGDKMQAFYVTYAGHPDSEGQDTEGLMLFEYECKGNCTQYEFETNVWCVLKSVQFTTNYKWSEEISTKHRKTIKRKEIPDGCSVEYNKVCNSDSPFVRENLLPKLLLKMVKGKKTGEGERSWWRGSSFYHWHITNLK